MSSDSSLTSSADRVAQGLAPAAPRVNGLAILGAIVLAGFGMVLIYSLYYQPMMKEKTLQKLESAPTDTEGKLELWREFGAPQIVEHLRALRVSPEQDFLASFVVQPEGDGSPKVYGLDLSGIGENSVERSGQDLIVRLPEPGLVAEERLRGPNSEMVPVFPAGSDLPDPRERIRFLFDFKFESLVSRLQGDLPGVRVTFALGEDPPFPVEPDADAVGSAAEDQ